VRRTGAQTGSRKRDRVLCFPSRRLLPLENRFQQLPRVDDLCVLPYSEEKPLVSGDQKIIFGEKEFALHCRVGKLAPEHEYIIHVRKLQTKADSVR
jgi:hypothetical protein